MGSSSGQHTALTYVAFAIASLPLLVAHAAGLRTGWLAGQRSGKRIHFDMNITLTMGSPDCGPARPVVLINGLFQPSLRARVGDTVQITIRNRLPTSLPQTASGISIHFHGMSMWDGAAWADGTSYVTQCPLQAGDTWTYSFLANEAPGTYFYHDHSALNRANGLTGAVVLDLPDVKPPIADPDTFDGEYVMFINDWYSHEANMMGMMLNRPYDESKATNDSGTFQMPGNAASLLINGKGNRHDCNLTQLHTNTSQPGYFSPVCEVTAFEVGCSGSSAGCTHEQFTVERGKMYRIRVINAGTQQYMTVCFENHTIQLMAADTTLMDYPTFDNGCFDINSGQRYDVALTADQPPGLYWVSVHTRYSTGSPSTFAVLRYGGAPTGRLLPSTPTPQATVPVWTLEDQQQIATSDFVLGYNDNYDFERYYQLFRHGGAYDDALLYYSTPPDKVVVLNMTVPVMSNGMMKWAMNNIAMSVNPPCTPVMEAIVQDPNYLSKHLAPPDTTSREAATQKMLSTEMFDTKAEAVAYNGSSAPVLPVAGMQVIELKYNSVVDVIINNLSAGEMNGDYYMDNMTRKFSVQHPMHMHGQHFYVLGTGPGVFSHAKHDAELNYRSPILRDTVTVEGNSWLYLRFRAKNPGIWPLHCHIMWHAFMGQQVYFATAMDRVAPRPSPGPKCPTQCVNNFAPFSKSFVAQQYKGSRYQLPS